jgi:hypothetical protein
MLGLLPPIGSELLPRPCSRYPHCKQHKGCVYILLPGVDFNPEKYWCFAGELYEQAEYPGWRHLNLTRWTALSQADHFYPDEAGITGYDAFERQQLEENNLQDQANANIQMDGPWTNMSRQEIEWVLTAADKEDRLEFDSRRAFMFRWSVAHKARALYGETNLEDDVLDNLESLDDKLCLTLLDKSLPGIKDNFVCCVSRAAALYVRVHLETLFHMMGVVTDETTPTVCQIALLLVHSSIWSQNNVAWEH